MVPEGRSRPGYPFCLINNILTGEDFLYAIPEFKKMPAQELKRAVGREFLGLMARKTPIMANQCLG